MTGAAETPSSTVRYVCPLEWCGWTYEAPTRAEGVLPSQFADAYRRQAARTEIAIAAHLDTHPRVDFVAEIHRLRNTVWTTSKPCDTQPPHPRNNPVNEDEAPKRQPPNFKASLAVPPQQPMSSGRRRSREESRED